MMMMMMMKRKEAEERGYEKEGGEEEEDGGGAAPMRLEKCRSATVLHPSSPGLPVEDVAPGVPGVT